MSTVNSVPRKQGRRLAGTDFVHFGVESLFARELRSNGDMHNLLETRSENWYGFYSLKTSVKNGVFWSEIESGIGEPGSTSPPRIPRSTSPPPLPQS